MVSRWGKYLDGRAGRVLLAHMANQITASALNDVFHALADPTRRAVVHRLLEGEASVTALSEPFEMALPTFLKHLRVLEGSGLIRTRKTGRVRRCALNTAQLRFAETWFADQRAIWERKLDALGEYLEAEDAKERDDDGPDTEIQHD